MTNFCKDCRWWDRMDSQLGRCRRYPAGPRNNDPTAEWVRMRDTDWCGEWAGTPKTLDDAKPVEPHIKTRQQEEVRAVIKASEPPVGFPSLGPPRRGPGRPPKDPAA